MNAIDFNLIEIATLQHVRNGMADLVDNYNKDLTVARFIDTLLLPMVNRQLDTKSAEYKEFSCLAALFFDLTGFDFVYITKNDVYTKEVFDPSWIDKLNKFIDDFFNVGHVVALKNDGVLCTYFAEYNIMGRRNPSTGQNNLLMIMAAGKANAKFFIEIEQARLNVRNSEACQFKYETLLRNGMPLDDTVESIRAKI